MNPQSGDLTLQCAGFNDRNLYPRQPFATLLQSGAAFALRRVRRRVPILERHRQVKCFWDLTRFRSTAWSLIVNQLVFVCLTYSLLQTKIAQVVKTRRANHRADPQPEHSPFQVAAAPGSSMNQCDLSHFVITL